MAPKNDCLNKTDSIKSPSFSASLSRKVTRENSDPKEVPIAYDPERLLRRSNFFQDKASTSKGKPIPQKSISYVEEKFTLIPRE